MGGRREQWCLLLLLPCCPPGAGNSPSFVWQDKLQGGRSLSTGSCLPPLKPVCGRCCSSERPGRQKCWERRSEGEEGLDGREAVPRRAPGTDRRLSDGASPLPCQGCVLALCGASHTANGSSLSLTAGLVSPLLLNQL